MEKNTTTRKKHKITPPPPKVYCDECNLLIDDIILEHYIIGERKVCNICYHKLIQKPESNKTKQHTTPTETPKHTRPNLAHSPYFTSSLPPRIPTILFNIPPIPLVPPMFATTTNKPDDELTNKNKNKNKNKKKKDTQNNSNKKNKPEEKYDNDDWNISYSSNDDNTSTNFDDGNIFVSRLINTLRNRTDNNSSNTNKTNYQDDDENDTDDDEPDIATLEYEWLGAKIANIDDLIELGKSYHSRKRKRYNMDLKQLSKLVEPLTELKNMIGMQEVKKIVFDQIIYYLQNLDTKNVDMLHTVIVGPPGVGKTQLTHIIAKIYNRLGFLKTDKVICAKRDDLIGEYIGQTAPKTRKLLERALGGVLLLDEIYSLSPTSERDFAREAIDMINMYLSEHAHDLVCVVAGYKKPTYEKFFSQNEGLARRFTHHFEIKGYSPEELVMIFKKYLEEQKWKLGASIEEIIPVIKANMAIFPNFGGDMTTLFACCKKTHSRRLLTIPTEEELIKTKKNIMLADINDAIKLYKEIKEKHTSIEEEDKTKYSHMYS